MTDHFDACEKALKRSVSSAAKALDVSSDVLLSSKRPQMRKALCSAMQIGWIQLRKCGILLDEAQLCGLIGISLSSYRKYKPKRVVLIRALRSAGYTLAETADALHLRRATCCRLAQTQESACKQ